MGDGGGCGNYTNRSPWEEKTRSDETGRPSLAPAPAVVVASSESAHPSRSRPHTHMTASLRRITANTHDGWGAESTSAHALLWVGRVGKFALLCCIRSKSCGIFKGSPRPP
eukprot:scaffold284025_cov28-Tisochrysis_lutea.AAC.3